MNKPMANDDLIPVRDYANSIYSRRGFPVSVQYVYKLIKLHKTKGKVLPFEYVEIGKGVWIKRN